MMKQNNGNRSDRQCVYIVEDHAVMRSMLQEYLEEMTDYVVAGAVGTTEEALRELDALDVQLLLIDVALPGKSGIDLVAEAHVRRPELPCLMYSAHHELVYVRQSLEAGARGYILKGKPEELPDAIRQVLSGKIYLSEPLQFSGSQGQTARAEDGTS